MKISIHQPYFAPYLGHFRLLSEVDLHVILDDVQHIRRGYVHRNRLPDVNGNLQWLTLPLSYAPQDALITDLRFAPCALWDWMLRTNKFPALSHLPIDIRSSLMMVREDEGFVPYTTSLLHACADALGIRTKMMRSSELRLPAHLRGEDRILTICGLLGADHYLNSPGGRALYNEAHFAENGIKLEFLPEWTGPMESVLCHLAQPEKKAA